MNRNRYFGTLPLFVVALVTAFAAPAARAQIEPTGIMNSIAIDPTEPNVVFVSGSGKVYRSDDRGGNWTASIDTLLYVNSLAIRPADTAVPGDSRIVFAGTSDLGVLRSLDNGATWSGDPAFTEEVRSVAVHPDGETVYAGAESGLFVSHDRGATWELLAAELSGGLIRGIVVDRTNPNNIYASVWKEGVYASTDGGQTWQFSNTGLANTSIFDLDMHPTNPSVLYASTAIGVHESVDAGATWSQLPSPFTIYETAIDPGNPLRMFVGTRGDGISRSTDGGQTWQRVDDPTGVDAQFYSIEIGPDGSGHVYAGSVNCGLYVSSDFGDSWTVIGRNNFCEAAGPSDPTPSGSPSLTMQITDLQNGNSVKSGREARFRIVIRNPGTAAIENLRYSGFWKRTRIIGDGDPYPFRLTASQGSCSGRSCTLGTVAAGGQVTVEFYGETPAGVLGWYRMTAHAESDNTGSLTQQAEIGTSVTVASSEGGIGSGGGSAGIVFVLALSLLACRRRLLATS